MIAIPNKENDMELISKDEAIVMLEDMEGQRDEDGYIRVYKCDAIDNLRSLPTIEERKEGHWIRDGHHIRCSECSEYICDKDREGDTIPQNYCPNCGAYMKGE